MWHIIMIFLKHLKLTFSILALLTLSGCASLPCWNVTVNGGVSGVANGTARGQICPPVSAEKMQDMVTLEELDRTVGKSLDL